jgi:hypothetical protein
MNRVEAERLLSLYSSGELTEDQRRTLMEAVLTDQDIYNAFAEEQVLSELLNDANFRRQVKVIVAPKRSVFASWKIAIAVAALVLVLFAGLLRRSMRSEKTVARGSVPAVTVPPQTPEVIALLLLPGERASGVENILRFPPGRHTIQLQVDLEGDAYPQYEAMLQTVGRKPVPACGALQTQRTPGSSRLVIELNCDSLATGVYTVTIFGLRETGKRESAGAYTFRVN